MDSKPLEIPKYLYKYRTIDQNTERFFVHREIYFAAPSEFNDPFDSKVYISFGDTEREIVIAATGAAKGKGLEAIAANICLLLGPERPSLDSDLQFFNELINDNFAMFSMSEIYDNILMWSHYAHSHTGICLKFNNSKLPMHFRKGLVPVSYTDNYPMFTVADMGPELCRLFWTKSSHWSYEKEWRIIQDRKGVQKIPMDALDGVILGCAISDENEQKVRSWMKMWRPKPVLYRAVKKQRQYGLDIIREK